MSNLRLKCAIHDVSNHVLFHTIVPRALSSCPVSGTEHVSFCLSTPDQNPAELLTLSNKNKTWATLKKITDDKMCH